MPIVHRQKELKRVSILGLVLGWVLGTLLVGGIMFAGFYALYNHEKNRATQSLTQQLNAITTALANRLSRNALQVTAIEQLVQLSNPALTHAGQNVDTIREQIKVILQQDSLISHVYWQTKPHSGYLSPNTYKLWEKPNSKDPLAILNAWLSNQDWVAHQKTQISPLFLTARQQLLHLSQRITSLDGQHILGVLTYTLDLHPLLTSELMPLYVGEFGSVLMMDGEGTLIFDANTANIGRNVFDGFHQEFDHLLKLDRAVLNTSRGSLWIDRDISQPKESALEKRLAIWNTFNYENLVFKMILTLPERTLVFTEMSQNILLSVVLGLLLLVAVFNLLWVWFYRKTKAHLIQSSEDVTAHLSQARRKIKDQSNYLYQLMKTMPTGAMVVQQGHVVFANSVMQQWLTQGDQSRLLGSEAVNWVESSQDKERVLQLFRQDNLEQPLKINPFWLKSLFGDALEVSLVITPTLWNESHAFMLICDPVGERKRYFKRMEYLAYHDDLTSMYNRIYALERGQEWLTQQSRVMMMSLDIEGFKIINETYGHELGDQLLRQVSNSLLKISEGQGKVFRMGADEFMLWLCVSDAENAEMVLESTHKELTQIRELRGHTIYLELSIALVEYPLHGTHVPQLLQKLDLTLFEAQQHPGRHFKVYDESIMTTTKRYADLSIALHGALDRKEFFLVFQPQVRAENLTLAGCEVLIRWQSKEFGAVSPGEFIPILESSHDIVAVGDWVLNESISQFKTWLNAGMQIEQISVNVSVVQLSDSGFSYRVEALLQHHQLDAQHLVLEVVESQQLSMQNPKFTDNLNRLSQLGVHISIDDFGTGYSALSYISDLPVDELKIDQSFVRQMDNPSQLRLIEVMVEMADTFKFISVAEGVETPEQAQALTKMGVTFLQGYYFSRPLTADDFALWVKNYQ